LSLTLRFLPEAVRELEEAVIWYRQKSTFLGDQFAAAFETAMDRMIRFPDSFPVYRKTIRRALLRSFPYGVFYVHGNGFVQILAVFHLSRDPKKLYPRA